MKQAIACSDVRQESISQSLSFGCSLNQSCDVYYIEKCRYFAVWFEELDQVIESSIRNRNSALIWVNCTEGKVFCSCHRLGQDIEECRFTVWKMDMVVLVMLNHELTAWQHQLRKYWPNVWKTYNSNFKVGSYSSQEKDIGILGTFLRRLFGRHAFCTDRIYPTTDRNQTTTGSQRVSLAWGAIPSVLYFSAVLQCCGQRSYNWQTVFLRKDLAKTSSTLGWRNGLSRLNVKPCVCFCVKGKDMANNNLLDLHLMNCSSVTMIVPLRCWSGNDFSFTKRTQPLVSFNELCEFYNNSTRGWSEGETP